MNADLFQRLSLYRATMAAVKQMLDQGLITADEYDQIDRMFAQKYGFELSTICR
jgi:hypothetical protein